MQKFKYEKGTWQTVSFQVMCPACSIVVYHCELGPFKLSITLDLLREVSKDELPSPELLFRCLDDFKRFQNVNYFGSLRNVHFEGAVEVFSNSKHSFGVIGGNHSVDTILGAVEEDYSFYPRLTTSSLPFISLVRKTYSRFYKNFDPKNYNL